MLKRLVLTILAVLGSLIATPVSCPAQTPSLSVPVHSGDCVEIFTYRGELEASRSENIHAPDLREVNLMTIRRVLDDGAAVRKGDVVVEMEDAAFRISLATAKEELEVAQSELERVTFDLTNETTDLELNIQRQEIDLEKAKVMVVENSVVVSRIDLQKAKLAVELAQLEVDQARKARIEFDKKKAATLKVQGLQVEAAKRKIAVMQDNIDKGVVRAPKDGIVYKPFVRMNNEMGRIEPGKVVRPGDKLLELPNMDAFKGVVYIPSPDYQYIHIGDSATITLTVRPEVSFSAKVIAKDLYSVSRNERLGRNDAEGYLKEYKVILEIAGSSREFRPGMTFQADIGSLIARNCLYVPRVAVASLPAQFAAVKLVSDNDDESGGSAESESRAEPADGRPAAQNGQNGQESGPAKRQRSGGRRKNRVSGDLPAEPPSVVAPASENAANETATPSPSTIALAASSPIATPPAAPRSSSTTTAIPDAGTSSSSAPSPAVVSSDHPYVWVPGRSGPEMRPVTIGAIGVTFIEIRSGLASGEQVFLDYPN